MNIEEIREYCISKPFTTESFPFDDTTLVFKVHNKMFAILSLDEPHAISLKCDPERAIQLRAEHTEIRAGYHLNKRLWNTIDLNGFISNQLLIELIEHSYQLIWDSLPKKFKV